ncbi:MAG: hypothetical protein V3U92_15320 [Cellulophaga sp.]
MKNLKSKIKKFSLLHFFTRKVGVFIAVPLLFISNGKVPDFTEEKNSLFYTYTLNDKKIKSKIEGDFIYEMTTEKSNKGELFSVVRLKMKNRQKSNAEFVISKPIKANKNSLGTYLVINSDEGFLNSFNGVFGYVNFTEFEKEFFFTKKGGMTIAKTTNNNMFGKIKLTLKNNKGTVLQMAGDFIAKEEINNLN